MDFSLTLRDPNLPGTLHVGNNLLWHPNEFGPIIGNGDGDPDLPSGRGNYRCGGE